MKKLQNLNDRSIILKMLTSLVKFIYEWLTSSNQVGKASGSENKEKQKNDIETEQSMLKR